MNRELWSYKFSQRVRRGILFAVYVLVLFIYLMKSLTPLIIGELVALFLVSGYFLVYKGSDYVPACANLAYIVALGPAAFFLTRFELIAAEAIPPTPPAADPAAAPAPDVMKTFTDTVGASPFAIAIFFALLIVGAGFFAKSLLVKNIGLAATGAMIILCVYGKGTLSNMALVGEGKTLMGLFLVASACWAFVSYVSFKLKGGKDTPFFLLSVVLLMLSMALMCVFRTFAVALAAEFTVRILALPATGLAWWRGILTCVALVFLAVVLADRTDGKVLLTKDSDILLALATLVACVCVLVNCYFVHSWILGLFLVVAAGRCAGNAAEGKRTMNLKTHQFLPIAFGMFFVLALEFWQGMFPLVIITLCMLGYVVSCYVKQGSIFSDKLLDQYVVGIPVLVAFGWACTRHNSVVTFAYLAIVLVIMIAGLKVVYMEGPTGEKAPWQIRAGVCGATCLLCMFFAITPVSVAQKIEGEEATVTIVSKGTEEDIASITSSWSDSFGKPVGEPVPLAPKENKLAIQSDVLTIKVKRKDGVTSEFTYYFADWMHGFGAARDTEKVAVADAAAAEAAAKAAATQAKV